MLAWMGTPSDTKTHSIRLGAAMDRIAPDGEVIPNPDATRRIETFKTWKTSLWAAAFAVSRLDPQYLTKSNVAEWSGLTCIDVDRITPRQAIAARSAMAEHPSCAVCFVSPSLMGVKAVMRIPVAETHAEYENAYNAAREAVRAQTGHETDAGKDSSRLCFLPPDPRAMVNPSAVILDVPEPAPSEPVQATAPPRQRGSKVELALALIDRLPPYPPGQGTRDAALPVGWALCGLSGGDEQVRQAWRRKLELDGRKAQDRLWTSDDWEAKAHSNPGALFSELTRIGVSAKAVGAELFRPKPAIPAGDWGVEDGKNANGEASDPAKGSSTANCR